MLRNPLTRARRQRGQSLIETGLMIVVVFTVVFWVFEICQLLYTYTVISDAAHEGVRYAIVHSGGDVTGTQARVLQFAQTSMHNVSGLTSDVTFLTDAGAVTTDTTPPVRVRVRVTYTYMPYLQIITTPPTIKAYSEGRMVVE